MAQALPPGAHADVPESTYHTRELGVASKSALDLVHRSPKHYKAWIDGAEEDDDKEALRLGSAFHMSTLEPEKFIKRYVAQPDFGDCRKTENKKARNEWRAAHAGLEWVDGVMLEKVRAMTEAVKAHPMASKLLFDEGPSELTIRWEDAATGVQCKARADKLARGGRTAIDLKSCRNADFDAFRRSVATYGYHRQAAFYSDGFRAIEKPVDHFLFVAVESAEPYGVAVFSLTPESIAMGLASIRDDLETLASCLKTGEWPGYPMRIQTIDVPKWAA
jgi:exodeoxyribonuclease VIII